MDSDSALHSCLFLRVCLKNVNSLSNKTHYISYFSHVHNVDIFCVNETWISSSSPDGMFRINGYQMFRNDYVSAHPKHGVCIYIKSGIRIGKIVDEIPNLLAVHLPDFDLYILTLYRPPSNSHTDNLHLVNFLQEFVTGKEVLILGDFNLPSINWNFPSPDQHASRTDKLFFECFTVLGLSQSVLEPTFVSSGNILDLVLSTESDRIMDLNVFPPFPNCGHALVNVDYLFHLGNSGNWSETKSVRTSFCWSRGRYAQMNASLSQVDWDFEFMHLDVNETNEVFCKIFHDHIKTFVPNCTPRPFSLPWERNIPPHLSRGRTNCWREYKALRAQWGRQSHQALQALYRFNTKNLELKYLMLNRRIDYEVGLLNQYKEKPKLFHAYIRGKKTCRPKVGPLSLHGELVDCPAIMAEMFVDAFSSVFVPESPPNPFPHQSSQGRLDLVRFHQQDVAKCLLSLNPDSSGGPDDLHSFALKQCASAISYPLTALFNKSMTERCVPNIWKVSDVAPIYKKKSRSDPLNYRPISLTSVSCKMMERLVSKQLYSFLCDHFILDNSQFGFRPKRSVVDQLLLTYNCICYWYDQKFKVDLILFDFSKAFDVVHHETLLDKLFSIGIRGNLLAWIRSFLCGRTMSVKIQGSSSSTRKVLSGVPQGSVLGPLLFIIFINHIGHNLTTKYMIFADDLKLYFHHSKSSLGDSLVELQQDVNILYQTATSWGLKFCAEKCIHIRFQRPKLASVENSFYYLNELPIRVVHSHRDLGIVVDSTMRFHEHVGQVANKAGGLANCLLKSTVCRSLEFMKKLFISDIRPIIDFASQVWNLGYIGDTKLLETVQRRWTKQVSGLVNCSYRERLIALDLYSIKGRLLRSDLICCWKIFHGESVISPEDLFTLAPSVGTRGHSLKIHIQRSNIEAWKRFLPNRVAGIWNSLPQPLVEANSLNAFKKGLSIHCREQLFDYHD